MDEADVLQRARAFVAGVDTSNIQTDLSPYLAAANAKVIKEEMGAGESGSTITTPKGKHIIHVNSLEPERRQRFTVCHELAHIVLGLPSTHDEVTSWSFSKRDPNEVMCDLFAAELLMPYQQWLSKMPEGYPSLEVIEFMATEFQTSFPAAASRYANLARIPCAFVTMDKGRVRYAARSTTLRRANARIPARTPVPPGSVAYDMRANGVTGTRVDEIAQDVWFENWEKGLDLFELSRHYKLTDTTVSLLWFDEEDLPEIEVTRFGTRLVDDGGLAELTGELPWPSGKKRR